MDVSIRCSFTARLAGFMHKYPAFGSFCCWYEPCFTIDRRINKAKAAYENCIVRSREMATRVYKKMKDK